MGSLRRARHNTIRKKTLPKVHATHKARAKATRRHVKAKK